MRPSQKTGSDHLSQRVAAAIRDYYPISRAELSRKLNISPSTITRVVDRLISAGIVSEEGLYRAGLNGRPSTNLLLNQNVATLLAVDLRLTEAYVALADLGGKILYRVTEPLDVDNPEQAIRQLIQLLRQAAAAVPQDSPLRAIIVGAPSIVDPGTGLVEWAPSLGWTNIPLGEILAAEFGLSVRIENDVNLAALGEYWKSSVHRKPKIMVFVSVGTGIGAGILINGELYHGATCAAGEVSYFITDLETLRDQGGKVGNLEARVGREGTLLRANLVAQRYPASHLAKLVKTLGPNLRAADIFTLAQEGDPAAAVVFNETVDLLTIVISDLAVVLDPEIIVLGGPSDWKWETLVENINNRIGNSFLRPINLQPSRLGREAVVMGAAYLAIQLDGIFAAV